MLGEHALRRQRQDVSPLDISPPSFFYAVGIKHYSDVSFICYVNSNQLGYEIGGIHYFLIRTTVFLVLLHIGIIPRKNA
jgi:hypothetical protein